MCGSETREDLNLTPATDNGCACCSTDSSPVVSAPAVPAEAAATRYKLKGLTCGHCARTVETAVAAVQEVESATVELVAAGISSLTVSGNADMASLQAAVENAGYALNSN